ncbi:DUF6410 domain-containing protein [Actinomycetes bacterium KLBMP 9797]
MAHDTRAVPPPAEATHPPESGFTIGRDLGPAGRLFRLTFGLAAVASLAYRVDDHHDAGGAALVLAYLALIVAGYLALFWVLDRHVLRRANPWTGSLLLQLPTMLYPLNIGPLTFHDALAAYSVVGLLVCAGAGYGGMEAAALPSLVFRRWHRLYTPFNTADIAERALVSRRGSVWAVCAAAAAVFAFVAFWIFPLLLTVPPLESGILDLPPALALVLLVPAILFAVRRQYLAAVTMVVLVPLSAGRQLPDVLFGVIMLVGLILGVRDLVRRPPPS